MPLKNFLTGLKRIVNIARTRKEADEWDVRQQLSLTPNERQKIAKILKEKYFGKNSKDLKEFHKKSV